MELKSTAIVNLTAKYESIQIAAKKLLILNRVDEDEDDGVRLVMIAFHEYDKAVLELIEVAEDLQRKKFRYSRSNVDQTSNDDVIYCLNEARLALQELGIVIRNCKKDSFLSADVESAVQKSLQLCNRVYVVSGKGISA